MTLNGEIPYSADHIEAEVMLSSLSAELSTTIMRIAREVASARGEAWLTGGCVRDLLLSRSVPEADIEVFGLPADILERVLATVLRTVTVGRSFGVFKGRDFPIDISIPRTESKTGSGHRGFAVTGDPFLPPHIAARRRDFTINAISWNPLTRAIRDPMRGRDDLRLRCLRHCSDQFAEDPLRVLRAMQFSARLDFEVAPETIAICAKIDQTELPRERIYDEWRKLLVLGERPSRGLQFLSACGWLQYYPELAALQNCPQDPQWHPEGDVWTHTLLCLDAFAQERVKDGWEDLIVGLAVLGHDMGKPLVTEEQDGRIRSAGHDIAGEGPVRNFLARITAHNALIEAVIPLVMHHMRPCELYKSSAGDAAVRRLARAVGRIDRLARVVAADLAGTPPRARDRSAVTWLLERSSELAIQDARPKPLVQGRDLIALGYAPGPRFKRILDACFEAQIDGVFSDLDGGIAFAQKCVTENPEASE